MDDPDHPLDRDSRFKRNRSGAPPTDSSDWVVPEVRSAPPPRNRRVSANRGESPAKKQHPPRVAQNVDNDGFAVPPFPPPRASWQGPGPPGPYYDNALPFHPAAQYAPNEQQNYLAPYGDPRDAGDWRGGNAHPYDAHPYDAHPYDDHPRPQVNGTAVSRYPRSPPDEPIIDYPDNRRRATTDQTSRPRRISRVEDIRLEDARLPAARPHSAKPPRETWHEGRPEEIQPQRPKHNRSFSMEDRGRMPPPQIQQQIQQQIQPQLPPPQLPPQEPGFDSSSRHGASRISNTSMQTSTGEAQLQYRPITGTEFRLLRLLPASMSTIKCEILHASLDTSPEIQKYTAISYAWGDVEPNMRIEVDRSPVLITPSLHGALKRLRQQDKSIMVWADALCIDQRNKAEQSQQISMMTSIYGSAESVAVWLGDEGDDSDLAIDLIWGVFNADHTGSVPRIISTDRFSEDFTALVKLFERDFWERLWVVQEILNAQSVKVYCGNSSVAWEVLQEVSTIFQRHEKDLRLQFPRGKTRGSRRGLSYAHVLSYGGPASLELLRVAPEEEDITLLEVLRVCRPKLAAEPRDKVFGVLGILPQETSFHFPPNYGSSLREVYTNVVDLILHTTRRLDVICEAIYFPVYTSSVKLPSWVPDWSHIPSTAGLGTSYEFKAASEVDAEFQFLDAPRRSLLQISAIYLDQVDMRGVAVGTFCSVDDYLMAFLHWRAKLLSRYMSSEERTYNMKKIDEAFCRTLCLGQEPTSNFRNPWMEVCNHVFASLIRDRLPHLHLDNELEKYLYVDLDLSPEVSRMIIQENCASRMEGRCFFTTKRGLMGVGSGFMKDGDIICVPLGCKTPIILRPEADSNQFRLVGDAYVDKYMDGKAIKEWKSDRKKLISYVLQ